MTKDYTVYNNVTGRMCYAVTCNETLIDKQELPENCEYVEGIYLHDEYYYDLANTIATRPEITATANKTTITADGVDTFILTSLPIPCTVTVDDTQYDVTDGEFGFTTDLAGTYTVMVKQFPYISKTWEVTAI